MVFGSLIRRAKGFQSEAEEREFNKALREERQRIQDTEAIRRRLQARERGIQAAHEKGGLPLGLRLNPDAANQLYQQVGGSSVGIEETRKKLKRKQKDSVSTIADMIMGA